MKEIDLWRCYSDDGTIDPCLFIAKIHPGSLCSTCQYFIPQDHTIPTVKLGAEYLIRKISEISNKHDKNGLITDMFDFKFGSHVMIDRRESNDLEKDVMDTMQLDIFDTVRGIMYSVVSRRISATYTENTISGKTIKAILEELASCTKKKTEAKESTVGVVIQTNYGYDTCVRDIDPMDIDITENYNDDFIEQDQLIKEFLTKSKKSGIVILRGEAGTGKSSYIRYLTKACPAQYVIIQSSMAACLGDTNMVSYLLECKDSIFILEDCEQVLADRQIFTGSNSAISTILNMTDGILSDIYNIKFICTFNADVKSIDSAILRPGRCVTDYRFERLTKEKTKALFTRIYGIDPPEKEMTLAEIYNWADSEKRSGAKPERKKKIGFQQ